MQDLKEAVLQIYDNRSNLANTLKDTRTIVGKLERLLGICLQLIFVFFYLAIFNARPSRTSVIHNILPPLFNRCQEPLASMDACAFEALPVNDSRADGSALEHLLPTALNAMTHLMCGCSAGESDKDVGDSVQPAAVLRLCVRQQHQEHLRGCGVPLCRQAL